jgi:hypothetical protein
MVTTATLKRTDWQLSERSATTGCGLTCGLDLKPSLVSSTFNAAKVNLKHTGEIMLTYQRVLIPIPHSEPYPDDGEGPSSLSFYGIIRLIDGDPERTYCCSLTPSVFVQAIGWSPEWPEGTDDDTREEFDSNNCEGPSDSYFTLSAVARSLHGEPFDADDDDDAREEAHGNW